VLNSFFPATSTLQQAPYEKTMVKSKKKAAKQPVAGTFGEVRKHVVQRTVVERKELKVSSAKRGALLKTESAAALLLLPKMTFNGTSLSMLLSNKPLD